MLAHPERRAEYGRRDREKNAGRIFADNASRRAAKKQRAVQWADREALRFFYECRPAGCHVDHVLPLTGKTVSGLHVETNLQWLPAEANLRKHNKVQAWAC
jgi:hypothetical protein